jgi:hypothetical protein
MGLNLQIIFLLVIVLPVASITWTVTHEQLFHQFHEGCVKRTGTCKRLYQRKFFYLFTCEFCFSHYVTVALLFVTRFKMLISDWRGYLIGGFAVVWVTNVYIALFMRLRLDVKEQRVEIGHKEGK